MKDVTTKGGYIDTVHRVVGLLDIDTSINTLGNRIIDTMTNDGVLVRFHDDMKTDPVVLSVMDELQSIQYNSDKLVGELAKVSTLITDAVDTWLASKRRDNPKTEISKRGTDFLVDDLVKRESSKSHTTSHHNLDSGTTHVAEVSQNAIKDLEVSLAKEIVRGRLVQEGVAKESIEFTEDVVNDLVGTIRDNASDMSETVKSFDDTIVSTKASLAEEVAESVATYEDVAGEFVETSERTSEDVIKEIRDSTEKVTKKFENYSEVVNDLETSLAEEIVKNRQSQKESSRKLEKSLELRDKLGSVGSSILNTLKAIAGSVTAIAGKAVSDYFMKAQDEIRAQNERVNDIMYEYGVSEQEARRMDTIAYTKQGIMPWQEETQEEMLAARHEAILEAYDLGFKSWDQINKWADRVDDYNRAIPGFTSANSYMFKVLQKDIKASQSTMDAFFTSIKQTSDSLLVTPDQLSSAASGFVNYFRYVTRSATGFNKSMATLVKTAGSLEDRLIGAGLLDSLRDFSFTSLSDAVDDPMWDRLAIMGVDPTQVRKEMWQGNPDKATDIYIGAIKRSFREMGYTPGYVDEKFFTLASILGFQGGEVEDLLNILNDTGESTGKLEEKFKGIDRRELENTLDKQMYEFQAWGELLYIPHQERRDNLITATILQNDALIEWSNRMDEVTGGKYGIGDAVSGITDFLIGGGLLAVMRAVFPLDTIFSFFSSLIGGGAGASVAGKVAGGAASGAAVSKGAAYAAKVGLTGAKGKALAAAVNASPVAAAGLTLFDGYKGYTRAGDWFGNKSGRAKGTSVVGGLLGGNRGFGGGNKWTSALGNTAKNTAKGAAIGTAIMPGIGSAVGAGVGGLLGAIGGDRIARGVDAVLPGQRAKGRERLEVAPVDFTLQDEKLTKNLMDKFAPELASSKEASQSNTAGLDVLSEINDQLNQSIADRSKGLNRRTQDLTLTNTVLGRRSEELRDKLGVNTKTVDELISNVRKSTMEEARRSRFLESLFQKNEDGTYSVNVSDGYGAGAFDTGSMLENPLPGQKYDPYSPKGISSQFGYRTHPVTGKRRSFHSGTDFRFPMNTPVPSASSGMVSYEGWKGGYGKTVDVRGDNGYLYRYAHLNRINVRRNQRVDAGQILGKSGTTGRSTGPHLHFEVRKDGKAINPMDHLRAGTNTRTMVRSRMIAEKYGQPSQGMSVLGFMDRLFGGSPSQTSPSGIVGDPSAISQLAVKYEVGNRGPGVISRTKGDYGGASYGKYQYSYRMGSLKSFVDSLAKTNPDMHRRLSSVPLASPEFDRRWKQIATERSQEFSKAQDDYTASVFYQPLVNKIKRETGLDVNRRSLGLKAAIFSTAVQHGMNTSIPTKVIKSRGTGASDVDLIRALYSERGAGRGSKYFKSSSARVQRAVANRFSREVNDALALIPSAHKEGMSRVPRDNYPAILHQGEMVLTKEEADTYRRITDNSIKKTLVAQHSDKVSSADLSRLSELNLTKVENSLSTLVKIVDKGFKSLSKDYKPRMEEVRSMESNSITNYV